MTQRWSLALLLALALLLPAGCYPRELIRWSPDGERALVVGVDALHACDADGELSEPLVENVTAAAWLPDGERFVAAVERERVAWDDIAEWLSPECGEAIQALGDELAPDLHRYRDDPERLRPKLRAICDRPDVELLMVLYLRDHHREALEEVWPEDVPDPVEIGGSELRLYSMHDRHGVRQIRRLDLSLLEHRALEVCPEGELLACVVGDRSVLVAPLDGSASAAAATDRLLPTLAWSPEGGAVFAVDRIEDNGVGRLRKLQVRDAEGRLELPRRIEGAAALLGGHLGLRIQASGADLLVGAGELELPAPASRRPRPRLYRVVAGEDGVIDERSSIEPVELPEVIDRVVTFAASPDGRHVLVLGDSATVLVNIETGRSITVARERMGRRDDLTVIPAWRGDQEVWLVHEDRLVRIGLDGRRREVEKDWPAEILPSNSQR